MLRKLVRRHLWSAVLLSVFLQTSPLAAVATESLPPLASLPSLTSVTTPVSLATPPSVTPLANLASPPSVTPLASLAPRPGVTPLARLALPPGVTPLASLSLPPGVTLRASLALSPSVTPLASLASPPGVTPLASLESPPSVTPLARVSSLPITPTPAGVAKRHGILYKVSRSGSEAYLFGTIHVGIKSFYPLSPEVHKALAASTELVLELDTRAEGAYARAVLDHGSYGDGELLQNSIAPATLDRLTQALHALGITVASMSHLKPWLIANILMGLELQRSGFERGQGNEFALLAHAQEHGTEVIELESADYQLTLFDTLSASQSERYLLESLAQLSDGSSLRKAMATIDAWHSGDATALDALVPAAVDGDSVMSEFTRRVLLGRRNPEMAARIERIMQDGKTAFVGVGLLHLLGANGLPQLLSQHGYQVDRVY